MDELARGMKDADPTIRAYSKAAHDSVMAELNKTKQDAYIAGGNAGTAFGDGFAASVRSKLTGIGINIGVGGLGGRDAGGPVTAGMPYIVGEKRPELFVPQTNGYILPEVPTGKGQNITIEHVEIADAHDEFSLVQSLRFLAAVQG
jgi:hypothetical protein